VGEEEWGERSICEGESETYTAGYPLMCLKVVNQLLPNAFKKTYAYRSNSFSINYLPEPV